MRQSCGAVPIGTMQENEFGYSAGIVKEGNLMDHIAKFFGYKTEGQAFQNAIQNPGQQALAQDGSQHPVENGAFGEEVQTIIKHDTAPPVFPTLCAGYDKKAGKAVFTFSEHSNDELQTRLRDCLLKLWENSGPVKFKWRKNDDGLWELRIRTRSSDPRRERCLNQIRTLMSNCEVLGYTNEKFLAAAKQFGTTRNILNAICDPSITFIRYQTGAIGAITQEPGAAMNPCLEALVCNGEVEAAYALLASRDDHYGGYNYSPYDYELVETICNTYGHHLVFGCQIPLPEGLLIYQLAQFGEHKLLATELLLRSLDRREGWVEKYVMEEVSKVACNFDKTVLSDLKERHCSQASQDWLRQVEHFASSDAKPSDG
jgi:hypothetical protein